MILCKFNIRETKLVSLEKSSISAIFLNIAIHDYKWSSQDNENYL